MWKFLVVALAVVVGMVAHEGFRYRALHFTFAGVQKAVMLKHIALSPEGAEHGSVQAAAIEDIARWVMSKKPLSKNLEEERTGTEQAGRVFFPPDINVEVEEVQLTGAATPSLVLDPCNNTHYGCVPGRPAMVYLHGGTFVVGSARTYLGVALNYARAANASAVVCELRLVPEASPEEIVADAKACLKYARSKSEKVLVMGDSAGGAISLMLHHALRKANDPLPAGYVLLSPWVDLDCTTIDWAKNRDWLLSELWCNTLAKIAVDGLGAEGVKQASATHFFTEEDAKALPPTLVNWGSIEAFAPSIASFVETKLKPHAARVDTLVGEHMFHDYGLFTEWFPEGKAALNTAREFFQSL
eukprot:Sspe_Gene.68713::Locus_40512_Transcript_1_1_Confidence_1.000_Length_1478::g.68713::m.68713/K14731/mlhB, chnC; epsilon-lactone hydrolase